jgi:hypothetical protein
VVRYLELDAKSPFLGPNHPAFRGDRVRPRLGIPVTPTHVPDRSLDNANHMTDMVIFRKDVFFELINTL